MVLNIDLFLKALDNNTSFIWPRPLHHLKIHNKTFIISDLKLIISNASAFLNPACTPLKFDKDLIDFNDLEC